jgi:protein-L-isoaspartate(D-aspartate) O-methyltransferase
MIQDAAVDDPPLARTLREDLVRIVAQGVRDPRVLAAMSEIPRHVFVPNADLVAAYEDHPISIGYDATISQPSLVGIMSAALELDGDEHVLEIGTGSGYQAAVLSRLAGRVDTVEVVPQLAEAARQTLAVLGCRNVAVHVGDGWSGWPTGAPYDRVVVTAAPDVMPTELLAQVREGGMLLVPVGVQTMDQRLERWLRRGETFRKQDLGAVRFVPMIHA